MTSRILQIDGRKFRIIPESEYQSLCAAMRWQRRQAKLDASDLAEAKRRIKDPKRKLIPLSKLKSQMGL